MKTLLDVAGYFCIVMWHCLPRLNETITNNNSAMKKAKTERAGLRGEYMAPEALTVELAPEEIVCVSTYSIQELEESEDVFTWQ